jgi:hypothetical protein
VRPAGDDRGTPRPAVPSVAAGPSHITDIAG